MNEGIKSMEILLFLLCPPLLTGKRMSLASPSNMGLLVLSVHILAYLQMILQTVLITQIMLYIQKYSIILVEGREEDCFLFGRSEHLSLGRNL